MTSIFLKKILLQGFRQYDSLIFGTSTMCSVCGCERWLKISKCSCLASVLHLKPPALTLPVVVLLILHIKKIEIGLSSIWGQSKVLYHSLLGGGAVLQCSGNSTSPDLKCDEFINVKCDAFVRHEESV